MRPTASPSTTITSCGAKNCWAISPEGKNKTLALNKEIEPLYFVNILFWLTVGSVYIKSEASFE
jgi:hypothetical protein